MDRRADSGIEIRRILLLTKLRESAKGMTMDQIVMVCRKVPGWNITGKHLWDGVREVLQTLINDKLVAVKNRFLITPRGREYLDDPLKWNLNVETNEEVEQRLFWNSVYQVFDRAFARLRLRSKETSPDNVEEKSSLHKRP